MIYRIPLTVITFVCAHAALALASSKTDKQAMRDAYVQAMAIASVAEKSCGATMNLPMLLVMRTLAGIPNSENEAVGRELEDLTRSVASVASAMGDGEWCASVMSMFGPDGTIIKGIIFSR